MMMKDLMVDDIMSNLTSTSAEISDSKISARNESGNYLYPQQTFASTNQEQVIIQPSNKKKRSLPGNPDPDAEVIALSPKSLLTSNRFMCEICNKGFKRDQNLQLHRRGHNLPWKLKQRTNKDVIRKKVYVCPEPTCVHHEPSRALGDLTGIRKHFCRKHGEKKWKCEKCSKRYAVQSDWKAHSKICGTREYRCNCGTLFSRRDSFMTHRAFCDTLPHENTAKSISTIHSATLSQVLHNQYGLPIMKIEEDINQNPSWFSCNSIGLLSPSSSQHNQHFNTSTSFKVHPLFSNTIDQPLMNYQNPSLNSTLHGASDPYSSSTTLLQKAEQIMGVTERKSVSAFHQTYGAQISEPMSIFNSSGLMENQFGNKASMAVQRSEIGNSSLNFNDMMMVSLPSVSGFSDSSYGNIPSGMNLICSQAISEADDDDRYYQQRRINVGVGGRANDGLTRDFLGLRSFSDRDLYNMVGMEHMSSSLSSNKYGDQNHHNQTMPTWSQQ